MTSLPAWGLDDLLHALADPERRKIVDLLARGSRSAGDLAVEIGAGRPATSRHLKILKTSGVVDEHHPTYDARVRIYALKAGALDGVKHWLAETEAMWTDQLAGFKAHIEQ